MYIRRKVFSTVLDEDGQERLFSSNEIINEEDYLNELMYSEDYDDLNYTDRVANFLDKNPITIKKLREERREYMGKGKGKGRGWSAAKSAGAALTGAGLGAARGGLPGALGGAAIMGGAAYATDRAARRLRNEVRRVGGGGRIDDMYAREADRLAMLDGKMTKKEFKDKWYRHNRAR
jgi:hypothetical protein